MCFIFKDSWKDIQNLIREITKTQHTAQHADVILGPGTTEKVA